ncbi:MAG: hypothetical protein C0478_06875 [Planctomyces sp.]|nr:hypothetical protein [Planctomyces sp.]
MFPLLRVAEVCLIVRKPRGFPFVRRDDDHFCVFLPDGERRMSRSRNTRLNRLDTFRYHSCSDFCLLWDDVVHLDGAARRSEQPGVDGMDVSGVNPSFRVLTNQPSKGASSTDNRFPAAAVSPRDELHISTAGRMLDQLSQPPEIREQRLNTIREMIANGTYDTEAKLEAALEQMLNVWRDEK